VCPLDHAGLMAALFVAIARHSFAPLDEGAPRNAQNARGRLTTGRAGGGGGEVLDRTVELEDAVRATLVLVKGHDAPQVTEARSCPAGIAGRDSALGRMSMAKISVGMASVAHALGMSTIPLMRPSTGAVPRMA
jgi:hypothetical protein